MSSASILQNITKFPFNSSNGPTYPELEIIEGAEWEAIYTDEQTITFKSPTWGDALHNALLTHGNLKSLSRKI